MDKTYSPLTYQSSEYDCGLNACENALRLVVPRDKRTIRSIRLIDVFTLDDGHAGTSDAILRWLMSEVGAVRTAIDGVQCKCVTGNMCSWRSGGILYQQALAGGAVMLHVFSGGEGHYVVATGIDHVDGVPWVKIFDGYAKEPVRYADDEDVRYIPANEHKSADTYNALVKMERLNRNTQEDFVIINRANRSDDDPEIGEAFLVSGFGKGIDLSKFA